MGRSQSQAIGEVVAPVALLSGIALSPESPVWYSRHRRKVVISLRSPSLALLGLGLPLLLYFSSRSDRLAPYCFYTLGLCSLLISGLGYLSWLHVWLLPVFGVGVSCLPPLLPPGDMYSLPASFPVGLRSLLRPATHFRLCWFRLLIFLLVVLSALGSGT